MSLMLIIDPAPWIPHSVQIRYLRLGGYLWFYFPRNGVTGRGNRRGGALDTDGFAFPGSR